MKIISIDFDGVIHNPNDRAPGYKMGKPFHGARDSILGMKRKGWKVIISSARAIESQRPYICQWLSYFGIPYDEVTNIKPVADYYIDDKAIEFKDWNQTMVSIQNKEEGI